MFWVVCVFVWLFVLFAFGFVEDPGPPAPLYFGAPRFVEGVSVRGAVSGGLFRHLVF